MIATISMLDHRFSQGQNTAGAPLPLIPRRTSSSTAPRPVLAPSPSLPLPTRSSYPLASCSTTVTPPTPPKNESDSSSRRVRGRPSLCPPELSTPVPTSQHVFPTKSGHGSASQPMLYTPGISLRLGGLTSVPKQRGVSESHVPPVPIPTTPSDDTRLIRKKCGQLVKSSLKSSRSSSRVGASVSTGGLSVFTMHQASKSEPTTPTSKAVHFDSKLEHVKLFLSEQKPLAVSRDGSPTDDTSGTDSDFPRFIFGASASPPPSSADTKLIMHLTNLPALPTLQCDSRLVALESLTLAPDASAIHGSVRVRNLAYSKAVRARFTFDNWMTTSEVCARWVESVPASLAPSTPSSARLPMHWDRFAFTIKLNDLGAVERERSRTLMLAVKYVVEGREAEAMWDNNAGCNYRATFSRVQVQPQQVQPPRRLSGRARLGRDEAEVEDEEETETEGKGQREARDMADLRSKLEKVVADASSSSTAALTTTAPSQAAAAATSFAARYDFAASYKTAWNPDAGLLAHANRSPARGVRAVAMHHRAQSFPLSSDAAKNVGGHHHHHQRYPGYAAAQQQQQSRTLGSPRDLGDDNEFHLPRRGQDESGYFDLPVGAGGSGTPPRYNSFPPLSSSSSSSSSASSSSTATVVQSNALKGVGLGLGAALVQTDSALSTPGMVSPASTSSSSSSSEEDDNEHAVADDDDEGVAALVEGDLMGEGGLEGAGMVGVQRRGGRGGGWEMANGAMAVNPDTPYRQFLNKFCFFTGPGSGASPLNTGVALVRTSAAAGLEDLLAAGMRSSESVASVEMGGSGSVTPTMGGVGVVASS